MTWVRRAGWGRDANGWVVWWSAADGRRGRRWRESVVRDGLIVHSLLLETDPELRFSHLELATPAGLLTLHPEADATLHGNVLLRDGLRHVVGMPWDPDALVLLEGSVVATSAALRLVERLEAADDAPVGFATSHPAVRIGTDLALVRTQVDVERAPSGAWTIADVGTIACDPDGVPVLDDARSWPLDADAG